MSILIVTEKPSVARQIAAALGKPKKEGNHLVVGEYVIAMPWDICFSSHTRNIMASDIKSGAWKIYP